MKFKSIVLLAIAIGSGLVAMLGVQQVLSKESVQQVEEKVTVLVATTDIQRGRQLDDTNTEYKEVARSSLIEGAVTHPDELEGMALRVPAYAGEVILLAKLAPKGSISASADIPEGMRLATVPVDATKSHSGLLLPGDHVDVLVTYQVKSAKFGNIKRTKPVLENIEVFATDSLRETTTNDVSEVKAKNVTFVVTADQAVALYHAQDKGQLHLTVRNPTDTAESNANSIDDAKFDSLQAELGEYDDDEYLKGPKFEGERPDDEGDIRSFLEQEEAANQQTASSTEQEVAPKVPMWEIEIFAGETRRVEAVALPAEPDPASDEPANGAGELPGWQGLLNSFLPGT